MNKTNNIGLAVQKKDNLQVQPINLKNPIRKYSEMIGEIVRFNQDGDNMIFDTS